MKALYQKGFFLLLPIIVKEFIPAVRANSSDLSSFLLFTTAGQSVCQAPWAPYGQPIVMKKNIAWIKIKSHAL